MTKLISYLPVYITLVLFLAFFTSCSNSVESDDHEEHTNAFGVALIMNGIEIAYQEGETINYESGNHIEIPSGDETDLITIRWISEDGDRFEAHADEGYSLQWSIENEDILEVEQHNEDGPWELHLVGKSEGSTEIEFELRHNDEHGDFTSLPFQVQVTTE